MVNQFMRTLGVVMVIVAGVVGCGGSNDSGTSTPPGGSSNGGVFKIPLGEEATSKMLTAMVQARPGDTIEFDCGFYDLQAGLQLIGTENITIKGCGKDKTVLSFRNSPNNEGILSTNLRGLLVEGLTVADTKANGIELRSTKFGTLRDVRTIWSSSFGNADEDTITADNYAEKIQVACTQPTRQDPNRTFPESGTFTNFTSSDKFTDSPDYTVSLKSGKYGIYPVKSENILVEDAESIGASDAGIYVGQTIKAIIRKSRTAFNVFGFEIENVQEGMYEDNLAECNTAGFLVYDLTGLTHHGKRTIVRRNVARNNNTYNYAQPGSIVAQVPRGSGFITLAYDRIDIYDNVFEEHDTASIILTSYNLLDNGDQNSGDKRMDGYSEAVRIWNNTFKNSGNVLPDPNFELIAESQGNDVASILPMLVGLKVAAGKVQSFQPPEYRGAHIVWDGLIDPELTDCPYPVDNNGDPIPADPATGKPESGNQYPEPGCIYNAYKFDEATGQADLANRIAPLWWFACVLPDSNTFDADSLTYANFGGTKGLESVLAATSQDFVGVITGATAIPNFPATFDMSEHDCDARFKSSLDPITPVVLDEYTPGLGASQLTPAEVSQLCGASVAAGDVNRDAFVANCPTLQDYHLFRDPADPRSEPNGDGVPFVLNSKLFTDHAVKYRVAYLPPGEPAGYRAIKNGASDTRAGDGVDETFDFPVGTVIAKTFAFADEAAGEERLIETRLLIKRKSTDGTEFWSGLPYIWNDDGTARLALEGGVASVSWDFTDANSGQNLSGSTANYVIPHQNQCAACHFNLNLDEGSAPVGPKARHMNRPYQSESSWPSDQASHPVAGVNQIKYWCENGLLMNCPADLGVDTTTQIATKVPRVPKWNVPGDSGFAADSPEDIESRVRAYLEINCQHCHNREGFASNTGFYLDVQRPVNGTYGICKKPTASGSEGRGPSVYDILPGAGDDSVLTFRIGPNAKTPAAVMPPLGRSIVHEEAWDLIRGWITNVVDSSYEGAQSCTGG